MSTVSTGLQKFTDEFAHSLSVSYAEAIALGMLSGKESFRGFGRRAALTTAANGNDLWDGTAVAFSYPDQSVGEQMTIVSSSANDAAAGSGVRTVEIHYLTSSGVEASETVTLNGITGVNTVATNIRFIQRMHALTTGSFGAVAAGNITLYKLATPSTVFSIITANGNSSLSSHRMIPVNKKVYINQLSATATGGAVSVRLMVTRDTDTQLTSGIFLYDNVFELNNSSVILALPVPLVFPALSIIKGNAYSPVAGGVASLSFSGWTA